MQVEGDQGPEGILVGAGQPEGWVRLEDGGRVGAMGVLVTDPLVRGAIDLEMVGSGEGVGPILMVMATEDGKDAGGSVREPRATDDFPDFLAVLDAGRVVEGLVDEDHHGLRAGDEDRCEPVALFGSDVALVSRGGSAGVISIEDDELDALVLEGMVSAGHAQERGGLFAGESTVHVVVSEDMVAWAVETVPGLEELAIAFVGDAEVTQLDDEIRAGVIHGVDECGDPPDAVVHDVLVDVGDDAEADRAWGARGRARSGNRCGGEGKLMDEPASAEAGGGPGSG